MKEACWVTVSLNVKSTLQCINDSLKNTYWDSLGFIHHIPKKTNPVNLWGWARETWDLQLRADLSVQRANVCISTTTNIVSATAS